MPPVPDTIGNRLKRFPSRVRHRAKATVLMRKAVKFKGHQSQSFSATISRYKLYNPIPPKILMKRSLKTFWVIACLVAFLSAINAQTPRARATSQSGPTGTLLQMTRAEDERRWNDHLRALLSEKNARVRKQAALAAGRIGDERALPDLVDLLKKTTTTRCARWQRLRSVKSNHRPARMR